MSSGSRISISLPPKYKEPIDLLQQRWGLRTQSDVVQMALRRVADAETMVVDFTALARLHCLDPVVGREKVLHQVMQILSRRIKGNALLVGDPGVGKSAIVRSLAQALIAEHAPSPLHDRELLVLDDELRAALANSGAGPLWFHDALTMARDRNAFVHLNKLDNFVGKSAKDIATILKMALSQGQPQFLAETTSDVYRDRIVHDDLNRWFRKVIVLEPDVDETIPMLEAIKERFEQHHGVTFRHSTLEVAASLALKRLNRTFHLPQSAINVLDEAACLVCARTEQASDPAPDGLPVVTEEDVHAAVAALEIEEQEDGQDEQDEQVE